MPTICTQPGYTDVGEQYTRSATGGFTPTRRAYRALSPAVCLECRASLEAGALVTLRQGANGLEPVCTRCCPLYGKAS